MSGRPLTVVVVVVAEPSSGGTKGTDVLDRILVAEALRLTQSRPGSEVVALSVGDEAHDPGLRRCLAAGAHRAQRIDAEPGSAGVAALLAEAARAAGADLVVCGQRRGADGSGLTGYRIARSLDAPVVNDTVGLEWAPQGDTLLATQWSERGDRTMLRVELPVVVLGRESLGRPLYLAVSRRERFDKAAVDVTDVLITESAVPADPAAGVEVVPARARVKKTPGAARAKTMTAAERRAAMRGGGAKPRADAESASGPVTGDAESVARRITEFLAEKGLV